MSSFGENRENDLKFKKTKDKYDPGEKSFPRETVTLYDGGLTSW